MKIFTIGFTKSTAERFFGRLKAAGARKVVDVRLNNISQLAGFAKRDDLRYFAKEICGMEYQHAPNLAPTNEANDYGTYKGSANNHPQVIANVVDTLNGKTTLTTNAMEGLKVVDIIERIYSLRNLDKKS